MPLRTSLLRYNYSSHTLLCNLHQHSHRSLPYYIPYYQHSNRLFSQSKKHQPNSNTNTTATNSTATSTSPNSSSSPTSTSTSSSTKSNSRIRKPSQFYQQHKPKSQQTSTSTSTTPKTQTTQTSKSSKQQPFDPTAALSDYSGVVTTASVNRPTPQFKDHQYSQIGSQNTHDKSSFAFGPGSVPHETLGSSNAAYLAAQQQHELEIGSPEHTRNMLLSLGINQNPTMQPTPTFEESIQLFIQGIKKSYKTSSIFSKIMAVSVITLLLIGDWLDRLFLDTKKDPNMVYSFINGSSDESIMSGLKTGDIICMQSPLWSFNILNTIRTILRQFVTDGPFDHCGIIICNKHDSDFPYVIEVNQNQWYMENIYYKFKSLIGMNNNNNNSESENNNNDEDESEISGIDALKDKYPYLTKLKITPFDERIIRAREPSIYVRAISRVWVDPEINEKLSDWLDNAIVGEKHNQQNIDEINELFSSIPTEKDSLWTMLKTIWLPGDNTISLRASMKDLKRKIALEAFEITTQEGNKAANVAKNTSSNIGIIRNAVYKQKVTNTEELKQKLMHHKLELQLKKDNLLKRLSKVNPNRRVVSSEFVGNMWHYMELLDAEPDGPTPQEIRPNHFDDEKLSIPLKGFAVLGPGQWMKTLLEPKKMNQGERDLATLNYNQNSQKYGIMKPTKKNIVEALA